MIPKILFRTVPERTTDEVERWWSDAVAMHPGWTHITYRDPLNTNEFPLTSRLWDRCSSGAQKAGFIRLEALVKHGGIYIDSDVIVYRRLDALTDLQAFAAYEDPGVVPDAILGAEARHPAMVECLSLAKSRLLAHSGDWRTDGPWGCGPGVTTTVLPGRDDVMLFPPQTFYAIHYTQKDRLGERPSPWEFARHMWHNSWQGASS